VQSGSYRPSIVFLISLILGFGFVNPAKCQELYQSQFEEAFKAELSGDLSAAETIFQDLLNKTQSPRVELELARIQYQQGKYTEAKQHFLNVSKQEIPFVVRGKISQYLKDIETREGDLKFSVSYFRDSNPRQVTSDRVVEVLGFPMRYNPPVENKSLNVIRYNLEGKKYWDTSYPLFLRFNYLANEYMDSPLHSSSLGLNAVIRPSRKSKYSFGVTSEFHEQDRETVLKVNTLSATRSFDFKGWQNYLKISSGEMGYPKGSALDGDIQAIESTFMLKPINQNVRPVLSFVKRRKNSDLDFYSFSSRGFAVGLTGVIQPLQAHFDLSTSYNETEYGARDPIYLKQRDDNARTTQLNLQFTGLNVKGFVPVLNIRRTNQRSNIGVYRYKQQAVGISVEKIF